MTNILKTLIAAITSRLDVSAQEPVRLVSPSAPIDPAQKKLEVIYTNNPNNLITLRKEPS
jgi:hypothetical protein